MGEKWEVDIQVVIQTGYSFFRKLDIQNSCPSIPCEGGRKSQNKE